FHRDDQPDEVRAAAQSAAPVVVAEDDQGGWHLLLDGEQLDACDGEVDRLVESVERALADQELRWPDRAAPA
ncbi:hypothetical protein, partial [Desertibacillus haloalkaliphilus]|uniref:hypothetical protein n=1 Tax=Desertibacillus haloalkaliphilus TaxID=1328930 RepID=UPI001C27FBBB